jgi:hypothetical protein
VFQYPFWVEYLKVLNSVKLIAGLNSAGKFGKNCQTGYTDWCKIGLFGTVYRLVQNWIVCCVKEAI